MSRFRDPDDLELIRLIGALSLVLAVCVAHQSASSEVRRHGLQVTEKPMSKHSTTFVIEKPVFATEASPGLVGKEVARAAEPQAPIVLEQRPGPLPKRTPWRRVSRLQRCKVRAKSMGKGKGKRR